MELLVASAGFDDVAGNAHAANIDTPAGLGITTGVNSTTFAPSLPVRRDQMASFLARTLNLFGLGGQSAVVHR